MQFRFLTLSVVSLCFLSACSTSAPPPPTFTTCAAAAAYYKGLAGSPLDHAVTFSPHRVIAPHSAVTMDFNPQRLNVYTDDTGRIADARCG